MRQLDRYDTWFMGICMAFIFIELTSKDFLIATVHGAIMFSYIMFLYLIDKWANKKLAKRSGVKG